MFDLNFWKASAERAVKTFVQTLVALLGTNEMGVITVDWAQALSVAGSATLLSFLTSLASANFGSTTGPSLAGEATHPDTVVVEVEKKVAAKKPAAAKKTATKK